MMSAIITFVLGFAGGVAGGVLTWFVGKPIKDIEDGRQSALRVANLHAVSASPIISGTDNKSQAALHDAAASLRALSRAQPWRFATQCYCRHRGYNLERAAHYLSKLASGQHLAAYAPHLDPDADGKLRAQALDMVHICLNAHAELDGERVKRAKELMEEEADPN
jgi:hypothetical protein